MGNIREYSQRTSTPVIQNFPRVTADILTGGLAKGLQSAGGDLTEAASAAAKIAQESQEFEANKKTMREQQDLTAFMEEKKRTAPAGAEGFSDEMKDELDARKQKAMDEAKTEYERRVVDLNFSNIHLAVLRESQHYEADSIAKKQRQDLEEIFDRNNNQVRALPGLASEMADQEARLLQSAPGLDNNLKAAWSQKRRQEIFGSAFDGEVTRLETTDGVTAGKVSAYLTEVKTKGSAWMDSTAPEDFQRHVTRLERLKDTLHEKEQQQTFADFDEKMDQLQSTGVRTSANIYTPEWINKNVADPKKREAMIKREAIANQVGTAMAFVKDAPADKVSAEIEKVGQERETSGNFHVADARYQSLILAKKQRDAAFVRDQKSYTVSVSPALQNLQKELNVNPTPEKAGQFASMLVAEQQRLYPGVQPKILDQNEIGSFAAQMSSVSFDEKGAAESVKVLQSTMDKWGKWWPHVVRDLRSGETPALNDAQYVAASMMDKPHLKSVAEDVLKASAVPRKQLTKELGDGAESDAYKSAKESLSDFRRSLGAMPGGEEVVNSYAEAMTQLALYKQARGEKFDMETLADSIVNKSYDFEDTYRVPTKLGDTSKVKLGVEQALTSIDNNMDFVLPTSLNGLRADDVKKRYLNNLRTQGKAYTKGDDSGIRIVDGVGNQVFIRREGKVVPLEYNWGELQTLGADRLIKKFGNRPEPRRK